MQAIIIGKRVDRCAAEQGIEVGSEEIDAYIDRLRRVAEQDRRRQEARREELARKLEAKTLSDAERQSLSSELATLNETLANLDGFARGAAEDQAARRQVAAAFIRQWKISMKPLPATFNTSEGVTQFIFGGKTYYYLSDPGAAEMEVKHLQDLVRPRWSDERASVG